MPFPYNPFCENGVQESPQTFLNPEIINNDSADNIQSAAEDISNRFALSLDASCFGAELAAAVVLPVQAVLLRKLQAAQVAVVFFEVRGQVLYPELCLQFLPDGVDACGVLVGADGQGGASDSVSDVSLSDTVVTAVSLSVTVVTISFSCSCDSASVFPQPVATIQEKATNNMPVITDFNVLDLVSSFHIFFMIPLLHRDLFM